MQIQNINSKCNIHIHIQPQQLQYERCQFYKRIYTNDHLSSPDNHLDLESQFLWLDPNKRRNVRLRISKGKSGNKYFHISSYKYGKYDDFPNILVPKDAYSFVRALDEHIGELAAENFEQKLQIQDSQSTIEIAYDGHQTLKTVEFTGLFHKFQLELWFFPKTDKINDRMQSSSLSLGLIAFHKITMKKIIRNLNLKALPWLRKQMAEMLTKYDGTEEIEKEAPAQIPEQFFNLGNTNVLLPNCIPSSAGHSFEHKRMRQPQEFVNKKPISFQQFPKMDFSQSMIQLRTVELIGQRHKFQLELLFFPNEHQMYGQKQICLRLFAFHKIHMKERYLNLPLQTLPWLRKQMAEMLAKYDGTEQIEKEAPAKIPQQFLDDVSHPPLSNGIPPAGRKFEYKGMQPQFAIKNSSTFHHYPKMPNKMQNSNQSGYKKQRMPLTFAMQQKSKQSEMEENIIADEDLEVDADDDELLLDPLIAASGRKIRPLFDFEEDYEEKYRRLAEKRNIPFHY